jgi:hypothetical protein
MLQEKYSRISFIFKLKQRYGKSDYCFSTHVIS